MTILTKASHQWATRPDDERFTNLVDMRAAMQTIRDESRTAAVPSRRIFAMPEEDSKGLVIQGLDQERTPTHWSFGQVAGLAKAPAGYLRELPAPIAADCINYGLQYRRDIEDVGVLVRDNGAHTLTAATGPNYGRVWNVDVIDQIIRRFGRGDGLDGSAWKVPGEFGKAVTVTKDNTTLFASDRDMFIFLADEENRIEVPNRRGSLTGSLARGFFMWNSEVGSKSLGLGTFLFDYTCCNRIVWGVEGYEEVTIRHTVSAPDKFMEQVAPALETYRQNSTAGIVKAIANAREKKLGDDLDNFLKNRFGASMVAGLKKAHEVEEGRPIETLWDVTTAATAVARGIGHQDRRVDLERKAGKVLDLVAN